LLFPTLSHFERRGAEDTGRRHKYNTVLGCVTWEDIEPAEGQFDFSELDKVILGAREHGLFVFNIAFFNPQPLRKGRG
jgi:hypothetical protein